MAPGPSELLSGSAKQRFARDLPRHPIPSGSATITCSHSAARRRTSIRACAARTVRSGSSQIAESSGGRRARAVTPSDGKRPTRNMASSQIACVNFLLPLVKTPGALTAVLRAIDDDVTGVVHIEHQGTPSPVELEWIGLDHALEGSSVKSRGANSTSVDAFMVAETPGGRRAYLMEWKYVEEYGTEDKGEGRSGETRRRRYAHLYKESPTFNRKVPFDAWLFEPFYQILRLRLLADRMVRNRELGISEAKVVVVVPEGNRAYRERVTSPSLAVAFPDRTVSGIVEETLTHPDRENASVSQLNLAGAVRSRCGDTATAWGEYHHDRYGW